MNKETEKQKMQKLRNNDEIILSKAVRSKPNANMNTCIYIHTQHKYGMPALDPYSNALTPDSKRLICVCEGGPAQNGGDMCTLASVTGLSLVVGALLTQWHITMAHMAYTAYHSILTPPKASTNKARHTASPTLHYCYPQFTCHPNICIIYSHVPLFHEYRAVMFIEMQLLCIEHGETVDKDDR